MSISKRLAIHNVIVAVLVVLASCSRQADPSSMSDMDLISFYQNRRVGSPDLAPAKQEVIRRLKDKQLLGDPLKALISLLAHGDKPDIPGTKPWESKYRDIYETYALSYPKGGALDEPFALMPFALDTEYPALEARAAPEGVESWARFKIREQYSSWRGFYYPVVRVRMLEPEQNEWTMRGADGCVYVRVGPLASGVHKWSAEVELGNIADDNSFKTAIRQLATGEIQVTARGEGGKGMRSDQITDWMKSQRWIQLGKVSKAAAEIHLIADNVMTPTFMRDLTGSVMCEVIHGNEIRARAFFVGEACERIAVRPDDDFGDEVWRVRVTGMWWIPGRSVASLEDRKYWDGSFEQALFN